MGMASSDSEEDSNGINDNGHDVSAGDERVTAWSRWLPFLLWWPLVTRHTLRKDVMAGMVGAVLVLPQGMAFAVIAGMPPEYGLYAGMVPALIAAWFGSSWHLVSGPTTAASILLFAVLSEHAQPGSAQYVQMAITLTFLVGIIELTLGLLRVGVVVDFIPHAVVVGFTGGAAWLIITQQLGPFFGVALPQGGGFLTLWGTLLGHLEHVDPYVTQVGVVTLVLGMASRRLIPRIPYMMVALVGGSVFAAILIHHLGSEPHNIRRLAALDIGFPPLSHPDFTPETLRQLLPAALAVTILALTEALSIARAVALHSGQRIDSNQEFIGQGLSNLAGSFTSAYVATGSFNRTGINQAAGARTPLAAAIGGLALMALSPVFAPVAAYIPTAAMAGILFLVAWGLMDFHHAHRILRASAAESLVMVITFVATLLLDMEMAILAGVLLSLALYLRHTSRPSLVPLVPDPSTTNRTFVRAGGRQECLQIRFVRLDGSLFYGAVNHVDAALRNLSASSRGQRHLVLLSAAVNHIDVSGAEMLAQEAKRRHQLGGGLYFVRVKRTPMDLLERGGYVGEMGEGHFFTSKREVLSVLLPRLDQQVCHECQARIFLECPALVTSPGVVGAAKVADLADLTSAPPQLLATTGKLS
ncbi:MAG: SulP family inorganic anion transporter [Magnetococcus sp. WYHC-3]